MLNYPGAKQLYTYIYSGEITNQAGAAIEVASEKSFIKFFNSDGGLNPDLLKTAIAHFFSLYLPPNDRSNVPQMSIEIIKVSVKLDLMIYSRSELWLNDVSCFCRKYERTKSFVNKLRGSLT